MEFLELPGGGTHQPSSETRHSGRAQADEVEDDLFIYLFILLYLFPSATQATEPGPGGSIKEPRVRNTNLAA